MKKIFFSPLFVCLFISNVVATGFDIKTSSIIDQPSIQVLGDYNNSWYVIGFEKPNRPEKPARFYILKYAAGFPTAKSSPVYPPFGDKTDYLKAAIINGKVSIFYSRTERMVERADMVDSRDGYKQIPKIMRQDYDAVSLLPAGEPVTVFDEAEEHFAASGIGIAQSSDKTKTAILIKHYFRQNKFKVILMDTRQGTTFNRTYDLKTDKDLVNFRHIAVSNDGQILIEAQTQIDPLQLDTRSKKTLRYYFFSISNTGAEPHVLSLAAAIGGNQQSHEPLIACLNNGDLLISYDHYASEHSPVLKGISVTKYKPDFSIAGTQDISPDAGIINKAAAYQKARGGLEYLETRQLLPLAGGNFMVLAEYIHNTEIKDKVTGTSSVFYERNYLLAYRLDDNMAIKAADFIDKQQTAHNIGYAFSAQAYGVGNDAFILHNEDCTDDGEHGLSLLCTHLSGSGEQPVTQKIAHTSEDFFASMEHIYRGSNNRILLVEAKLVDFDVEARELKLMEVRLR